VSSELNIGVAGGGLLGRLIAWRALLRGHRVTLYEAGSLIDSPSAARTAAGMIAPLSEVVASERFIYDLGMASLALWPVWTRELGEASGQAVAYESRGSLAVAHRQDRTELEQFHRDLCHKLGDNAGFRWLDRDEIRELEPDLADSFEQGLHLQAEAHLDNRALLDALLVAIEARGGRCHANCPVAIRGNQIKSAAASTRFSWVIDCRGQGAQIDWEELRGVRGEVLTVECPEVTLQRPVRLMHPRYKLYIVPKNDHRFVVGATEIESEDRSPFSVQSMLELTSALYTVHPAFSEARIVETDVNLRPAFMDNLPRVVREPGLVRANGLYRHGYLLAPAIVDHVLGMVEHRNDLPFAASLGRYTEIAASA
jgi:glycine oxidase